MKLIKMTAGFIVGAIGALAAVFLFGAYFIDDDTLLMIFGFPLSILIGGGAGAVCSSGAHWSRRAFVWLAVYALIGAVLGTALWVLVPGRNTEPEMLALWFQPDRMLQQTPFGILFGAAIGASIGQISISCSRQSVSDAAACTKAGVRE